MKRKIVWAVKFMNAQNPYSLYFTFVSIIFLQEIGSVLFLMSRRARTTGASTVSNILNAKNCMEFLSSHLACVLYIILCLLLLVYKPFFLFIYFSYFIYTIWDQYTTCAPKIGRKLYPNPQQTAYQTSIEFIFTLVYYFQVKANQLLNRLFTKLTGRALVVLEFRVGFGSQVQLEGSQSQLEHSFAAPSTPAPSAGAPQPLPHLRLIFRLILIS